MISSGAPSFHSEAVVPDYHYTKITDDTSGTEKTLWTPASGKQIRIAAILVSVTAAGTVEFKDKTAGETIAIVSFNEKKAVPITLGFALLMAENHALSAVFTVDSGTADCHITVFGEEQ